MKRLILIAMAISFIAAMFYDIGSNNPKKISDSKEMGNYITDNKVGSQYQPSSVLDTLGRVPGMTGYYDYVTNGNNLHRIWVSGDTVIVSGDQTDSANAPVSTARRSYYQYTINNGIAWGSDAILVGTDGNAYPDLNPMVLSGSRTVALTGRQFVAGARRGYVGVDVVLGAGSFTNILNPGTGSDNFGAQMNANEIACGYPNLATDTMYFAKFNIVTNTYSGVIPIAFGTSEIAVNQRQNTAANNNQNVAVSWWFPTSPTKMLIKESSNNGTSFGTLTTIITEGATVNGDAVAPWFGADLIYKPGTTTLCMAFNTLAPGNFALVRSTKLLFWSPGVNGGNPVRIADWTNYPPMADTNIFNDRIRNIQVGMTSISHPGLAFSSNGTRLFVVYSGVQLDTVNSSNYSGDGSYNYNDVYVQYSDNNGSTWSAPRNLTNTADADEIYPSISRVGNSNTAISITYQLSACPGAASFTNTSTPICKVYQIYRKYNPETGVIIGIQNVSNEVPSGFSLMQNYPNPFNPNTKIRFAVPKTSNITIEVYDITGKLVATLARNEAVTPGVKEVEFNALGFSSGVYFYTLKAGDFVQTKKMILVK